MYQKVFIPKKVSNDEKFNDKFPLLKNFRPKYTKRENVDKKILRKFKLFLKEKFKNKTLNIEDNDKNFWIMFINGNSFPPMKYTDNNTDEVVEFRSFNSKFLTWLFSKKGACSFYEQFVKEQLEKVASSIVKDYNIMDKVDIDQLEFYIVNMQAIFTNLSNISGLSKDLNLSAFKSYLVYSNMPDTNVIRKERYIIYIKI